MNSANIQAMSDAQLIERVENLVRSEREVVECLIWHLQEIQDRKLYIQMGYTSLFECLVKQFKYSEPTAYCRISALKIITAVPEAAEALNSGEVNLTTLSLTQSFIRKQEKETGEKVSHEQKIQYLESIKNHTARHVKEILATMSPIFSLPLDKVQYLDEDHAQLHATLKKTTLKKMENLKSLISHENMDPSYNDLLDTALDIAIETIKKKKGISTCSKKGSSLKSSSNTLKKTLSPKAPSVVQIEPDTKTGLEPETMTNETTKVSTQSFSVKSSRYISRDVKRFVLNRSNHQCEYIHSNGQRCISKFQLQFDHIIAFSNGGGSNLSNIQTLCRVHNAVKSSR